MRRFPNEHFAVDRRLSITVLVTCLLLLAGCGRAGEGSKELTAAEQAARRRAQEMLAQARKQLGDRRYDRALELVDRAERFDPRFAEVSFARGEIFRQMGRTGEAKAAYHRMLELDGAESHPVRLRLGDLAREEKRHEEALGWYRKEWDVLTQQLEKKGQAYEDIRVDSRDGELVQAIQVRRARTHALMSQLQEAQQLLDEVLQRDPTHATAHYYLAKIHQERGHPDKALLQARQSVKYQPFHPVYRYLVGSLLVQAGRPDEAIPHLQRVVRVQPQHVGAHYNLGQAYMQTGRPEQGQRHLSDSDSLRTHQQRINQARMRAQKQRDDLGRWFKLANALREGGRLQEAAETYQIVLTMDSANTEAWLNLGVILGQDNQQQEARRAFRKVLEIEPGHPEARRHLDQL